MKNEEILSKITHPDKILFPDSKITKLDVAKYYLDIHEKLLEELKGRPVSLVRSPGGIQEGVFYQKHPSESFPDYIERVKIKETETTGVYISIDALEDIMYLVNIDVIEFHTWNCTFEALENPNRIIFDLDPDSEVKWGRVVEVARFIKSRLEKLNYTPKLKTSGGKGLHIIIDLFDDSINWETAKSFSKSIGEETIAKFPDLCTITPNKEMREGKIFVDYLRNNRGATTVAAYSLRAKEHAPISMPISWKDAGETKPDAFNIRNYKKV